MSISTALAAARNAAHDVAAIVGVIAGSTGAVVSGLDAVGIHVSDVNAAHVVAIAGLAITVASKAIDSLNDALKGGSTPQPVTPVVEQRKAPAPQPPVVPAAPAIVALPVVTSTRPPEPAA